jgi:predicted HAD superfamily Cof-like phosphohydrolase
MAKIEVDEEYLKRLLNERDRLAQQVTDLQRHGTELLEQRRSESLTVMVAAFHTKFGYPTHYFPTVPIIDADVRFRAALKLEEVFEEFEAMYGHVDELVAAKEKVAEVLRTALVRVNLPELADALGDIDYINEGTRLTFGIPRLPVAFAIQEANMSKTRTMLEGADAAKIGGWVKPIKPPGWKAPDIAGVLRLNGWQAT